VERKICGNLRNLSCRSRGFARFAVSDFARLSAAAFLLGFLAISFQVVLSRELLAFCYGNEVSLGLILGSWLFWTGLGSLGAAGLARRRPGAARLLPGIFAAGALTLPLAFVSARLLGVLAGTAPGEVVGLGRALVFLFPLPALYCLGNGACFALISAGLPSGRGPGRGGIYASEAVGAALGGWAAAVVPGAVSPSLLAGVLASGYLAAAALVARRGAFWSAAAVALLALALGLGNAVEARLSLRRWKGYTLRERRRSPYGELTVLERFGQFSLFANGLLWRTWPDLMTAQETVWPVLLAHPSPRRVLLLGGSPAELREILKLSGVEEAVWVEIDPAAIALMAKYAGGLPPGGKVVADDPRRMLSEDRGGWDVMILAAPEPLNAQVNRLYTVEFFRLAASRLAPGGLFTAAASSSPNYLGEELLEYLGVIFRSLQAAFGRVSALPGENCRFIASADPAWGGFRAAESETRASAAGVEPEYLAGGYLAGRVSGDRGARFLKLLEDRSGTVLNLDRRPVCYYYDLIFWSSFFRGEEPGWWSRLLESSRHLRWWWFLALAPAALLVRRRRPGGRGLFWAVAATGFNGILLQVTILVAFQVRHGSLYSGLGPLLGAFMLGSALGAAAGEKAPKFPRFFRGLVSVGLVLELALAAWTEAGWAGGKAGFFLAALLTGGLAGGVFSLGSARLARRGGAPGAGGMVYGLDLLGACLGGLASGLILVPVLGLTGSFLAAASLSLSSVLILQPEG